MQLADTKQILLEGREKLDAVKRIESSLERIESHMQRIGNIFAESTRDDNAKSIN